LITLVVIRNRVQTRTANALVAVVCATVASLLLEITHASKHRLVLAKNVVLEILNRIVMVLESTTYVQRAVFATANEDMMRSMVLAKLSDAEFRVRSGWPNKTRESGSG